MIQEKKCGACFGVGRFDLADGQTVQCLNCSGSGLSGKLNSVDAAARISSIDATLQDEEFAEALLDMDELERAYHLDGKRSGRLRLG